MNTKTIVKATLAGIALMAMPLAWGESVGVKKQSGEGYGKAPASDNSQPVRGPLEVEHDI